MKPSRDSVARIRRRDKRPDTKKKHHDGDRHHGQRIHDLIVRHGAPVARDATDIVHDEVKTQTHSESRAQGQRKPNKSQGATMTIHGRTTPVPGLQICAPRRA